MVATTALGNVGYKPSHHIFDTEDPRCVDASKACTDCLCRGRCLKDPNAGDEPNSSDAQDAAKYRALNTPEIADFLAAVAREALHQRERWGPAGDAGKSDADWFWLLGYLGGKAMRPDASEEKRLHHIITTAAACLNWHGARVGAYAPTTPGVQEDGSSA